MPEASNISAGEWYPAYPNLPVNPFAAYSELMAQSPAPVWSATAPVVITTNGTGAAAIQMHELPIYDALRTIQNSLDAMADEQVQITRQLQRIEQTQRVQQVSIDNINRRVSQMTDRIMPATSPLREQPEDSTVSPLNRELDESFHNALAQVLAAQHNQPPTEQPNPDNRLIEPNL